MEWLFRGDPVRLAVSDRVWITMSNVGVCRFQVFEHFLELTGGGGWKRSHSKIRTKVNLPI